MLTSASWLNAVEGFFADLNEAASQARSSRSVVDLHAAINRFLEDHNAESKPFEWVADPDKIIAAVRRGHQMLNFIDEYLAEEWPGPPRHRQDKQKIKGTSMTRTTLANGSKII